MPPRLVRKAPDTYHHGDLRDALVQAALHDAEQGGPEAISLKALAKKLGVSQPAPYRHFADREALLEAVTAEAFRQFNALMHESIDKPSKQSKLSRFAQATLAFGLRRNGIYRLMFASRTMACAAKGGELHNAAMETFALLLEALEAHADRERQAHARPDREAAAHPLLEGKHVAIRQAEFRGLLVVRGCGHDVLRDAIRAHRRFQPLARGEGVHHRLLRREGFRGHDDQRPQDDPETCDGR